MVIFEKKMQKAFLISLKKKQKQKESAEIALSILDI